jgi:CheY-like chemotaxis protein
VQSAAWKWGCEWTLWSCESLGERRGSTVTRKVAHILLTGDDIPFQLMTEKLLRGQGYICDCVHDVRTATAALEAWSYDLLIADLDLPGNRELELIRASQGDGCSMPAIVLTGYPSVSTAVQSLHLAVVVEYLIKPVTSMELLRCVGPAVATGRLWRTAFQAYDEMTARPGAIVRLERHGVSNGLRRAKAGRVGACENPLKQRGSDSAPGVEQRKETLEARQLGTTGQVTGGCALRNCPQLVAYEESLQETIVILQKAKTVSASKDLETLREKLEALLKNARLA